MSLADAKPLGPARGSIRRQSRGITRRRQRRQYQRQRAILPLPLYHSGNDDIITKQAKAPHTVNSLVAKQGERIPSAGYIFMLLAVQSDPNVMYRDDDLSFDERVTRSISSTCGMTVVYVNYTDRQNPYSEGLCTPTKWSRMDQKSYSALRPKLIFRDKFCNYRNFRGMRARIHWPNTTLCGGSLQRPFNAPYAKDGDMTANPPIDSMSSSYQFRPIAEFDHAEITVNTTPSHCQRLHRFAGFYRELLRFIVDRAEGATKITLYHRLPQNMLWLAEDMITYARHIHNSLRLDFIKMPGSASHPRISAHCLHRPNHNTVTCEICLFETYLPQLLNQVACPLP